MRHVFTPFGRVRSHVPAAFVTGLALAFGWLTLRTHNHVLPTLPAVGAAWVELAHNGLARRLWESYVLNLYAITISTVLSCALAYASTVGAFTPAVAFTSKLRFLGMVGVTFFLGMYVEGRNLQIVMLVLGIGTFQVTAMMSVMESVPSAALDHARTLNMGSWRVLYEVGVRGTFDQALDVMRQSAAMGWMMLTMVEGLVRSQGGVGVLLIDLNRRLALPGLIAVIITITVIGIVQDYVLAQLRLMLCPWVKS